MDQVGVVTSATWLQEPLEDDPRATRNVRSNISTGASSSLYFFCDILDVRRRRLTPVKICTARTPIKDALLWKVDPDATSDLICPSAWGPIVDFSSGA